MSEVTFIQTADPERYAAMLWLTSLTVVEYCRRHGHRYESYMGVKRGPWAWQATYNRLYQLKELHDRGYRGWVVHLDADAYVVDLDFDLSAYLADKQDHAAIFTPSGVTAHHWDINAGVFLLNLAHPTGQQIVRLWMAGYDRLSDAYLEESVEWLSADSDQDIIQQMLMHRPEISNAVYLQSTELMNSSCASFIRQHLRNYSADFTSRMRGIADEVRGVLGDEHILADPVAGLIEPLTVKANAAEALAAAYAAVLGRAPDPEGEWNALNHLAATDLRTGLADIIVDMLDSEEYRARAAAKPA